MSTHSRVPTHTVTLGLTGRAAIDAVARDLAGDGVSLTLHKFGDALGPAEHDIDLERAEEIMLIDPGLLRLDADVAFYSSHDETCGFCGKLAVQLWTRYTGWVMRPVVVPNTTPGPSLDPIAPETLAGALNNAADGARKALAAYLRNTSEDA